MGLMIAWLMDRNGNLSTPADEFKMLISRTRGHFGEKHTPKNMTKLRLQQLLSPVEEQNDLKIEEKM